MDRGAWRASVHRVEKSWTQQSNRDLSSETPEAAEITIIRIRTIGKQKTERKEDERKGGREREGVACTTKLPASEVESYFTLTFKKNIQLQFASFYSPTNVLVNPQGLKSQTIC